MRGTWGSDPSPAATPPSSSAEISGAEISGGKSGDAESRGAESIGIWDYYQTPRWSGGTGNISAVWEQSASPYEGRGNGAALHHNSLLIGCLVMRETLGIKVASGQGEARGVEVFEV